jgi:hypothetical protein
MEKRKSVTVGIDQDVKKDLIQYAILQSAKEGKQISARKVVNDVLSKFLSTKKEA